jgi:hypothetical protein
VGNGTKIKTTSKMILKKLPELDACILSLNTTTDFKSDANSP